MIIFLIVLAIIAVALYFVFRAVGKVMTNTGYSNRQVIRFVRLRYFVPGAIVILMLIVTLIRGICIIDSTQVGVVRTFGKINRQIAPGLNLVNPISDSVTTYDLRVHVRQASFASYTKDAQPLTASIEYQYALDKDNVMDVALEYGTYDALEAKLDNVVQERAKIVFAKYTMREIIDRKYGGSLKNYVRAMVEFEIMSDLIDREEELDTLQISLSFVIDGWERTTVRLKRKEHSNEKSDRDYLHY